MGILWQNRIYTMVLPYIYGFNRRLGVGIPPAVCVVSLVYWSMLAQLGVMRLHLGYIICNASEEVVCVGRRAVVRKKRCVSALLIEYIKVPMVLYPIVIKAHTFIF